MTSPCLRVLCAAVLAPLACAPLALAQPASEPERAPVEAADQPPLPSPPPSTPPAPATAPQPTAALSTVPQPTAAQPAAGPEPAAAPPTSATRAVAAPPAPTAQGEQAATAPAGSPVPAARPASGAAPRAGAPQADADGAARALERTLVERGGLLLPAGEYELVPELSYAFADSEAVLLADGTLAEAEVRRYTGAVTLRLGLPFRLQAEGQVPYVYAQQTPAAPDAAARTASGVGDVRAALTWHVIRAGSRIPDVLLTGFWNAPTGRSQLDGDPTDVPLGAGFASFGGGLSIVKAIDPLVLLAAFEVEESVPRRIAAGWLDPRASLGITTIAILAVSPETSLLFGLEQTYSQTARVRGADIRGTNRSAAVFSVGFGTLASSVGMLEVSVGIGLTQDVPRFQVNLATPLKF
jgi:hypothetical protein